MDAQFVFDLAVVMLTAGTVTVLFHQFRQPVLLGYIVAGVLIGPHVLPGGLITNTESIHALAQLGVILLMFTLGLNFSFRKLRRLGGGVLCIAFVEVPLMVVSGLGMGRLMGWSWESALFLGAILSISSTMVIYKTLRDFGEFDHKATNIIYGVLVVEDILAIAILALLPALSRHDGLALSGVAPLLGKLGVFLVTVLVFGLLFLPRLMTYVAQFHRNDMLLVTALGVCFGISLLALRLGYSSALGAFLCGAVIAESREISRIQALVQPVSDLFSAIFFVATGLLIDPSALLAQWDSALFIGLAFVGCKIVFCTLGGILSGESIATSGRIGMGLAQIGEFSYVIATLGIQLGVVDASLYPKTVAVSAMTMFLNPVLLRRSDSLIASVSGWMPNSVILNLQLYGRWLEQLRQSGNAYQHAMRSLVRKILMQIGLNVALLAAVFLTAVYFKDRLAGWLHLNTVDTLHRTAIWSLAILASLPLVIATYRKLYAFSMLAAEITFLHAPQTRTLPVVRNVFSKAILVTSTTALVLGIFLLSSTLLPPWHVVAGVFVVMTTIGIVFRQRFIKLYARAQISLVETLEAPVPVEQPEKKKEAVHSPWESVMRAADLQVFKISSKSWARNRELGELRLRQETGASVVGIERGTRNIVNPMPAEKLKAGDRLLLLGSREQIDLARQYLKRGIQVSA